MTINQFKNLLAFLCLAGNERCSAFLDKAPDYLVEKFERYASVETLRDDEAWAAGMHPSLRAYFDTYLQKWDGWLQEGGLSA